ncbi:hypothetical protein V3390_00205 [Luteimonas sp. FXH3W]|uniref:Uncharacterized protein n=1 Tax=Aquilutibacter rugosus TaxID=3115820 RepID=A0ABU7UYJ0_9GAMM
MAPGVSTQETVPNKNRYFREALTGTKSYQYTTQRGTDRTAIFKIDLESKNDLLLRIATNKTVVVENEDLESIEVDDHPSVYVIVLDSEQIIAVQRRAKAFSSTATAIRLIAEVVNDKLYQKELQAHFEPIRKAADFWNLVKTYENRIVQVRFDIVTPNMSDLSKVLSDDIKDFAKATNAVRTTYDIESHHNAALKLDPKNEILNGLVEYSSMGGGSITVKVRYGSMKKTVSTKQGIQTAELENVELEATGTLENIKSLLGHFTLGDD